MNAFERYLLTLPKEHAAAHIVECLIQGESDNLAWRLMSRFNGDRWNCMPDQLEALVLKTLKKLKQELVLPRGNVT